MHNHRWGEWTSNGNGTHTRTCTTDSSHTETGSCSGGKATGTEKAICETCHTAYGELLPLTKTVITTPPTLPSEGYVGEWYLDGDLKGGEAKAQGTDTVVPGSFRFKHNWGGRVYPGENRMEILFTPDDAETYATAECIVTVTGIKYTITSVIEVDLPDKPLGTAFEDLWPLPHDVAVKTNTGRTFFPIPVTWDSSSYDPNAPGEQIITGQLHVEESRYEDKLEPASTVKAIAKITLIGDGAIVPTLEPPTYSRQIYSGDFCQLAFSDEYLSGGKATANGETVDGVFTLNEEQEKYGYWNRGGGLVQVGLLALKVTFTPDDLMKYTTTECTVNVDVIPRKFRQANTSYIDNKKIGTAFEDLGLPNAFYFFAVADEPNHEGSGLNGNVPGIIKWDDSNYDPNSYEEQTIYGTVDRAEFEKYYIVPEGADLRGVVKVTLQADPVETEITQPPVFRWKNGDFTLPDNTMFVNRIFEMGATGVGSANLADGVARVKGTDTVVPGTFSFKEGTPGWFDKLGENVVTVVFTPTDQHGYRTAETTIKVNVIKNTFKRCEEPDPITEKKLGTTFAGLNLPKIVVVEAIDGLRVGMEVSWEESSYDAQSTAWQTIPGTLVFDANDEYKYQQPEPAVTAAIRVKLLGSEDAPAITTTTLPGGTVGTPYHHQLQATGGGFILWELFSGELPDGLTLKQTTGVISGTPTAEQTAQFTVRALNSVGNDKKELSITITNAPAAEHTVTVTNDGNGTASASHAKAAAGTEIILTVTPANGYHFKEWQVISGDVTITNDTFLMPEGDVTIEAVFEKDAPSTEDLVDPMIRIIPGEYGYPAQSGTLTAADFFQPGKAPANAKITAIAPPNALAILDSISVDNDGTLSYKKEAVQGIELKTETYTVTITSDDYAPISAPLTVRQCLYAGFGVGYHLGFWVYGDTRTYKWQVTNPGENGVWSAIMRDQGIFEIYEETVDTTSEPGVSHYTMKVRAIKAGQTFIDILYVSDTTASWSPWTYSSVVAGGPVTTRTLTVTAGSATITEGDALPADLVRCTGLLDSEGRTDDRDTVLDNALSYRLLNANNEEVAADTARNTPGTYTVVPAATLKSGWDERYSLNRVNGTLTVEDKVEELFTVTVTSGDNGTASASHAKAVVGTEIRLTATPNTGYHLKEWQVISGGVTIENNKFTMPSANVEVKAIFEKDAPPAPTEFTITVTSGDNGTASASHAKAVVGTEITLTATPNKGYHFKEWQVMSGGVTIKDDKFTMPSANVEVKAIFEKDTGGGGGGYNPPVTYYTLRFETGGGSDIPSVREAYNTYIDLTKYVPTWRGHTFIGWYTERSLMNKVSGVYLTKDMTVYAGWRVDENPGTGANPFTDVSEKDWFYGDVMFVYENGLMLGTSKTLFSPHGTATRGMMATILWRMEGSPAPKGKNSFTDVEAGKWYADAITWTAENGIFAGYGKDKFGPDDPITREQLAAIFYRYADYKGYDLTVKGNLDKFKDADKITDYAKTAMQWAVGSGLVKGKSGNLLDPHGTATRAEIAAMLHRFIEKYELVQGKAPGGLMGWIDPKRLQIPKTGDSSVLGLWGFSLCTSLAGCLALTTWQIRRRREEEALQIIEK
ncbi:InlB B-repeat-containing protein [uncultured Gemmiger sp.]|uniref:InlB B-repeat-containing protein n=1 Tax=uncultured Gemmiger sp. TaxID=1623490 RepID=UPI00266B869D|nr:S-layer homology domain-containing protein [uncultured Gemmiger sp.]